MATPRYHKDTFITEKIGIPQTTLSGSRGWSKLDKDNYKLKLYWFLKFIPEEKYEELLKIAELGKKNKEALDNEYISQNLGIPYNTFKGSTKSWATAQGYKNKLYWLLRALNKREFNRYLSLSIQRVDEIEEQRNFKKYLNTRNIP